MILKAVDSSCEVLIMTVLTFQKDRSSYSEEKGLEGRARLEKGDQLGGRC